jgi:general secretion pathway protein L
LNTLYLRIPASHLAAWPHSALAYALCSKDGAIVREGRGTLTELAKDIFKSKVTLLIAAADVVLLEIAIPAIPEAKLKLALPNLVEDHLIGDSADCVLTLLPKQGDNNKRVVAVVQRSWLQQLSDSIYALGASYVKALPAQLCIPYESGYCSVFWEQFGQDGQDSSLHYSLRSGLDSGMGILLSAPQSIEEHLSAIALLLPPSLASSPILLQLPNDAVAEYQAAVDANPLWADRIIIQEISWAKTLEAAKKVGSNLMATLNSAQTSRIQWQIWRWPLVLGAVIVLVNIVGLNIEYWSLKREANALKMGMTQTYKMSFPKSAVVAFPLDQMKKNLEIAQRDAGQPASYDFTVLLTEFGAAWSSINPTQLPKITSIDYKDRGLVIQVKGDMPQEELKKALSNKGLNLKKNNAETWQVREEE